MSDQTIKLSNIEEAAERNCLLTFEEYAAIKEPSVNIIVRDYACKLLAKAKEAGVEMTLEEAERQAREQIPAAFVPEWMKNLRIGANLAGTELTYLEGLHSELSEIKELLYIALEDKIEQYARRHAADFKRVSADGGAPDGNS